MHRPVRVLLMVASTGLLASCAGYGSAPRQSTLASATLLDAAGSVKGNATLVRDGGDGLVVNISVSGLPEGSHGAHLHTTGRCAPADFSSAGGHLNPGSNQHGLENPAGAHLGDLPNLYVSGAGTGDLMIRLNGEQDTLLTQLFDEDGTSIVIHAGADDNRTDPSGNSGARIACGVFARTS